MHRIRFLFLTFSLLATLNTPTQAQARGTIRGTVWLTAGSAAAGATISLRRTPFHTTTDAAGAFILGDVPPGAYAIVATMEGRTGEAPATVRGGDTVTVSITLGGPIEMQPITVSAPRGYASPSASTATKTDTPIMETPLSVQVVPQQVLQDQQATTLEQALTNVSGVTSNSNFGLQESITLRGFRTSTTFRNGFRIDDALGNGLRSMTNVDRVEVLKGPAAILYGRVEPGGVVNIVTRQPQPAAHVALEQEVGSWNHFLTNLDATGPLDAARSLLYRLNVSYNRSDSWRDAVQDERLFIAPTLQWRLSSRTRMTLEAEYSHNPLTYDAGQVLPYDTVSRQFIALPRHQNVAPGAPIPTDTRYLEFTWSHQFSEHWSIQQQIVQHEVTSSYDPFYYVAGFTQLSPVAWTVDRARSFGDGRSTTTSTVLDLTGHVTTAGLSHTLLVGADYYRWKTGITYGYGSTLSTTDAFNPAPPAGIDIDSTTLTTYASSTDNYGVYAQDQIALPGNVHVLGGLRYQKVTGTSSNTDATGVTTPGDPQSDHAVTPRMGMLWQPRPWLSIYANYARNFGANTGRDYAGNPMDPESAHQWEGGVKAESFGGRLRAGLTWFDLTKQNVATADKTHDPTGVFGYQVAIGEVESKGTEFDLQGEIQPGWSVIASYAHTDIRITKSNNGDVGLRFADVPQDMASLWSTYRFGPTSLRGARIGGGVTYHGPTLDAANTLETPGYTLVDAMAAYEFTVGGHQLVGQVNGNNLFNTTYNRNAAVYGNMAIMQFGTPRSVVVSVKFQL